MESSRSYRLINEFQKHDMQKKKKKIAVFIKLKKKESVKVCKNIDFYRYIKEFVKKWLIQFSYKIDSLKAQSLRTCF